MNYSRYEDAMVAQTRVLEHTESQRGRKVLNMMERSMQAQHALPDRMPAGFLYGTQHLLLTQAEPVYVADHVTELIDYARESFKPEPVRPHDAFTPHGFALLPRPLLLADAPENGFDGYLPVRAIAWMTVQDESNPDYGCFWISYYTHIDDDVEFGRFDRSGEPPELVDDIINYQRAHAPLTLVHTFQWSFGDAPWEGEGPRIHEQGHRCPSCLAMTLHQHREGCATGREGKDVTPRESRPVPSPGARERGLAQVALVQTFWRIAQQITRGAQRVPRGIWRDANRKGVKRRDVTVIRLRRNKDPNGYEHGGGSLSVQFIVRGHWRNQWYPSLQEHRQVWISPYVKGPEDAPFVATERAWEFTR